MKLKQYIIYCNELQDYLDKYEDKIKFILFFSAHCHIMSAGPDQLILIIDEA